MLLKKYRIAACLQKTVFQITEEDERTSSRSSLDKDFAEKLRKQLHREDIHETSSIVESEDGVSKITISGSVSDFKQVIEVKDDAKEDHRKISATLEQPITTAEEEVTRN